MLSTAAWVTTSARPASAALRIEPLSRARVMRRPGRHAVEPGDRAEQDAGAPQHQHAVEQAQRAERGEQADVAAALQHQPVGGAVDRRQHLALEQAQELAVAHRIVALGGEVLDRQRHRRPVGELAAPASPAAARPRRAAPRPRSGPRPRGSRPGATGGACRRSRRRRRRWRRTASGPGTTANGQPSQGSVASRPAT